jgi:DNA-directed RNA polymerase specialized sigma24 family protein
VASTNRSESGHQLPAATALAGILALLAEEREVRVADDKLAKKTEVVLADAGLSNEEIAAVTGKKPGAVRMAIRRARSS